MSIKQHLLELMRIVSPRRFCEHQTASVRVQQYMENCPVQFPLSEAMYTCFNVLNFRTPNVSQTIPYANNAGPDQSVPAVSSASTLFVIPPNIMRNKCKERKRNKI